jgi:hypothetical protein
MRVQAQYSWFNKLFCFTNTSSGESVSSEPLPLYEKQDVSPPEYNEKQDM